MSTKSRESVQQRSTEALSPVAKQANVTDGPDTPEIGE